LQGGQTDSNGLAIIHLLPGDYECRASIKKAIYTTESEGDSKLRMENGRLDVALEAGAQDHRVVHDSAGKASQG